jgi:hypothetical protein
LLEHFRNQEDLRVWVSVISYSLGILAELFVIKKVITAPPASIVAYAGTFFLRLSHDIQILREGVSYFRWTEISFNLQSSSNAKVL